jgi:hypothetical protein
MKFLLVLFASFVVTTSARATSCDVLEIEWYKTYTKSVSVAWDISSFVCASFEGKVAQALYDLHGIDYTSANSSGFKPNFLKFVTKKNVKLKYNKNCKDLATGNSSTKTITICPGFQNTTREDRAATIVHEARHLDYDDPKHVDCVGGRHVGKSGACDQTLDISRGSGYSHDMWFFSWSLYRKDNDLSNDVIRSHIRNAVPDRFNKISSEETTEWRNK